MASVTATCLAVLLSFQVLIAQPPYKVSASLDMSGRWTVEDWGALNRLWKEDIYFDENKTDRCIVGELLSQKPFLRIVKQPDMDCPPNHLAVENSIIANDPVMRKCGDHNICLSGDACG